MSEQYTKLVRLLKELFQIDQADLDFGIYRIMNQKAGEISQFLDRDLLPQVQASLALYKSADKTEIKAELDEAIKGAMALGAEPDSLPRVQELKAQLEKSVDLSALENEVYSQLYTFFRRYYEGGDFLSLRRYKEGVYAIPYEGEEVKLHWANHDQYYIKSCEQLKNYAFKTDKGRVRFELTKAGTERDNNKAQNGKERRFVLAEQPFREEDGELVICFEYRMDEQKRKQEALNGDSAIKLLNSGLPTDWLAVLAQKAPTEKKKDRTLFEKHLCDFTAKSNFDYFIHKDLGGFLRRELDFFIKNEVMHLDDIEQETAPRVEQYLSKIKALRAIAKKLIVFLEQLENFQKKLWLKKKFVLESNWCFTLDRVPESFYSEIAANEAQREEWVKLFSIDELEGYNAPLTVNFLKDNPFLVLDTKFFPAEFKYRLLAEIDDLDAQTEGLLIHSENFQALNLLKERYREQVKCIYIDPPYNTGSDEFIYKDTYQHSSWISMMSDRLNLAFSFLSEDGCLAVSIGEQELGNIRQLLNSRFGEDNFVSLITVKRASVTGHKAINPGVVNISEFLVLYAKNKNVWKGNTAFSERDRDERYNNFIVNINDPHQHWRITTLLEAFASDQSVPKEKLRHQLGKEYTEKLDEFVHKNASSVVQIVTVSLEDVGQEFREAVALSEKRVGDITKFEREGFEDVFLLDGKKILFYKNKVARFADRLATVEKASDIWLDTLPNDIHNEGGVPLKKGKKPELLLSRIFEIATDPGELVLDFFVGSGTAGAVAQKMDRKWIGIEVSEYFDTTTGRRIKNVLNGEPRGVSKQFDWKGGGQIQVCRLESYEDTLDNLVLQRSEAQEALLSEQAQLREDYMLGYMLDVETRGSQSLLNIEGFADPFAYQLKITRDDEAQTVNVDLIETFNYLLGLKVRTMEMIRDVFVLSGKNLAGERILILWRKLADVDNAALDDWFGRQDYSTRDMEFDLIYVNGDNNLENLKTGEERWKVRLIEQEFHRLMFDMGDA